MLVFKMSKLRLNYKGREGSQINKSFGKEKQKSHLSLRLGQFAMLLLLWEIFFTPGLLRRFSTGRGKCFPPWQKVKNIQQVSKQPSLRPVGMNFLGILCWWEWGWRGGEGDLEEKLLFLIENLFSWKHTYISGVQHATPANAYLATNKWSVLLCNQEFSNINTLGKLLNSPVWTACCQSCCCWNWCLETS